MQKYLTFLHYSYSQQTELFRDRLSESNVWNEFNNTDIVQARVLYALGISTIYAPNETKQIAYALFKKGIKNKYRFRKLLV